MDKSRYYIRKKLRKEWHRFFDHETKFELKDLSMKQLRLEFARDVEYVMIKCPTGEFLIRKLQKDWRKKTQYFHLWLVECGSRFRTIDDEISFGGIFNYVQLQGAKIYVRTSGESPQPKEYSQTIQAESTVEWAERLIESSAAKKVLEDLLRKQVSEKFDSFDFYDLEKWDDFKEDIDKLLSRGSMDIGEIVRTFNGDPIPKYYHGKYNWQYTVWEWEKRIGEANTKKKIWKACKNYVTK